MFPKVKRGCCGKSLRGSSLVLGWFQLVASILITTAMIAMKENIIDQLAQDKNKDLSEEDKNRELVILKCIYGAVIVSVAASGISSILLLYGIYRKNHQFMLPYIIVIGISIGVHALSTLVTFVYMFIDSAFVSEFFKYTIAIVISSYCWVIVNSYYLELKQEATQRQVQRGSNDGKPHQVENLFNAP